MPTLEWIGKDKVINHHLDVPYRVLEQQYSYGEDSGNMIIHGDNLSALKSLLPQYEGKIKCIYIDPPYNTGNENWVYNDNVNDPRIKKWLGEVVGKEGEDLSRHDKWLCMMYPRLKLLQRLLADDGVIFISIDDNEQAILKLICDEIFGMQNFVAQFIWERAYSPKNDAKFVSNSHDYVVMYAKMIDKFTIGRLPRTEEANARYKNPDNDPRGVWKPSDMSVKTYNAECDYPITLPSGRVIEPPTSRCWSLSEKAFLERLQDNRIWFGADGNSVPQIKRFLSELKFDGMAPQSILFYKEVGHSQEGAKEVVSIFDGTNSFNGPKPQRLLNRLLTLANLDKDSIILDSFAGSGTTAHAVLNMNKTDGGNRRFILIEMCDYAETITAERVRRVIDGYGEGKKVVEGTGGGFTFYELGEKLLDGEYLNENVPLDKIRSYIYFTETKQPVTDKEDEPHYLGSYLETVYYFYYDKDAATTLDHAFLTTVKTKAESYVIYADRCILSEEELERYHITFKKIPRDITRL
jgi:adenine specific DNA methylase mod